MKLSLCILSMIAFYCGIHAQEPVVKRNPADAHIRARYTYETSHLSASISLCEDSTYTHRFTGCSWWKEETGKWKIKHNDALILKVGRVRTSERPNPRISLRRHVLRVTEETVTATATFNRDQSVPFVNLLKPEPPQ